MNPAPQLWPLCPGRTFTVALAAMAFDHFSACRVEIPQCDLPNRRLLIKCFSLPYLHGSLQSGKISDRRFLHLPGQRGRFIIQSIIAQPLRSALLFVVIPCPDKFSGTVISSSCQGFRRQKSSVLELLFPVATVIGHCRRQPL